MAKSYLGGGTIIRTGENLDTVRAKRNLRLRATHPDPLSPDGAEMLRLFGTPEAPPSPAPSLRQAMSFGKVRRKDNGFPRTPISELRANWETALMALDPTGHLFIPSVNVACAERLCSSISKATGGKFIVRRWTGPGGKIGVNVWRKG